jgi:hypothetical protein
MSQLLENKQLLVHVASEVLVVSGITFYFHKKNKELLNEIEKLTQRIEDHAHVLDKHEHIIQKLAVLQSQRSTPMSGLSDNKPKRKLYSTHKKPPLKIPSVKPINSTHVSFTVDEESEEESSEGESDLDMELLEELEELDKIKNKITEINETDETDETDEMVESIDVSEKSDLKKEK